MSSQVIKPIPGKEKTLQEKFLREQPGHAIVSCDVCLKSIPKSLAYTKEAEDYFLYFCGLECYHEREQRNQTDKK